MMKNIQIEFNNTEERDRYIDDNFPERSSDDNTPGFFYVLGGCVSVFCEKLRMDGTVWGRLQEKEWKAVGEAEIEREQEYLVDIGVNLWPLAADLVRFRQDFPFSDARLKQSDVSKIKVPVR